MNNTQLKAKLKAAQKANAKKIEAAALKASLEAAIKLEGSKELFNSKVDLAVTGQATDALQKLINECVALVDSIPVINKNTRAKREWAGGKRFEFGTQINLMYQLATGILYSCGDHKQLLLNHTGLNLELVEQFVEAFGSPSYYSRNHNALVEAKPYNVERVSSTVTVMQSSLGVTVNTGQLTASQFSLEFGKAEGKAQKDKLAADEAIAEADMQI